MDDLSPEEKEQLKWELRRRAQWRKEAPIMFPVILIAGIILIAVFIYAVPSKNTTLIPIALIAFFATIAIAQMVVSRFK